MEGAMHRRVLLSSLLGLVALLSVGCDGQNKPSVKKNTLPRGAERTETRQIQPFDSVIANGRVHVKIARGASKEARLVGPGNYLEHLTVKNEEREVDGEKLRVLVVALDKGVKVPLPEVEVVTNELRYAEATGPAKIEIGDLSGETLSLRAGEATRIEMKPATYGLLRVETKVAARVLGPEVMVERAELSAFDFSFIQIGQIAQLKKNAAGGKISYKGTPELLQP